MADDRAPEELDPPATARGSAVADAVRKAVLAGVGALFLTEEGARRLAREWKLPKELIAYVGSQAATAKGEILRIVSDEVRKFFESEALRREFVKALSSMAVEIRAEIRVVDAGDGKPRPTVKASVRPRVGKRRGPSAEGDDE